LVAELIYRPVSGEYEEIHFGDTDSDCRWVKFTSSDYSEWVASFEAGDSSFYPTNIINISKDFVFVIASGNGYLIQTTKRINILKQDVTEIKEHFHDKERSEIYVSNFMDLIRINRLGEVVDLVEGYWFDEIKFNKILNNKLCGHYWDYQIGTNPIPFNLDRDNPDIKKAFTK